MTRFIQWKFVVQLMSGRVEASRPRRGSRRSALTAITAMRGATPSGNACNGSRCLGHRKLRLIQPSARAISQVGCTISMSWWLSR